MKFISKTDDVSTARAASRPFIWAPTALPQLFTLHIDFLQKKMNVSTYRGILNMKPKQVGDGRCQFDCAIYPRM